MILMLSMQDLMRVLEHVWGMNGMKNEETTPKDLLYLSEE